MEFIYDTFVILHNREKMLIINTNHQERCLTR